MSFLSERRCPYCFTTDGVVMKMSSRCTFCQDWTLYQFAIKYGDRALRCEWSPYCDETLQ